MTMADQPDKTHDVTAEVGSEGGSPGEAVEVERNQETVARGSEATEIAPPARERHAEVRRDDHGRINRQSR
jgi:hypothetical protein